MVVVREQEGMRTELALPLPRLPSASYYLPSCYWLATTLLQIPLTCTLGYAPKAITPVSFGYSLLLQVVERWYS